MRHMTFDDWWEQPIRLAGEYVPLWQILEGNQKQDCKVAFNAGANATHTEVERLKKALNRALETLKSIQECSGSLNTRVAAEIALEDINRIIQEETD